MEDRHIFEEMIAVYERAIPEMRWLGEFDWCSAANVTIRRLNAYLHAELKETPLQLARECHADLQGYIEVKYNSSIMDAQGCYDEGCFDLYVLSQRLVQVGGLP